MKSHPLPHTQDPATLTALLRLHPKSEQLGVFWLQNNQNPIIGLLPKITWTLSHTYQSTLTTRHRHNTAYQAQSTTADFTHFKNQIIAYHTQHKQPPKNPNDPKAHPFAGGLLGYASYDVAANALSSAIALPAGILAYFGHYDCFLAWQNNAWQLCYTEDCPQSTVDFVHAVLDTLTHQSPPAAKPITLRARVDFNAYRQAFTQTQNYLHAGDAYQINLTCPFVGNSHQRLPLVHHLPALFAQTRAPFCAYLSLDTYEIASVSPELFFEFGTKHNQTLLTTKPIKGTRARHKDPIIDQKNKQELQNSEKDRAENVMIVDLLRNDLGKYAQIGGVCVPQRFFVESFSNVHHLVSTVQATLTKDISALTVLFDSLPAGSITGSPKKRACELISTLEVDHRRAYCGTMGYINFDNTGQFNVLIRTLQSTAEPDETYTVSAWAGGGITVLSECTAEYQECLDKITQITQIVSQKS